ncbi:MAG: hypothetical protein HKL96_08765 [Phycisphaerales bacterium]|nr:hypothetical protein [Phycisphaerales bacterium]
MDAEIPMWHGATYREGMDAEIPMWHEATYREGVDAEIPMLDGPADRDSCHPAGKTGQSWAGQS